MRYFFNRSLLTPTSVGGKRIFWQLLPGNQGLKQCDDDSAKVIETLIKKGNKFIAEIDEATYEELKKKIVPKEHRRAVNFAEPPSLLSGPTQNPPPPVAEVAAVVSGDKPKRPSKPRTAKGISS